MFSKLLAVLRGGNQQNDSVDRSLSSDVVLHNQMENNDTSIVVEFEYTGEEPVPKNVTNIRFHPNVTEIEHGAFSYKSNLRGVVLNEGLKWIPGSFGYCTSLESVTLPSTISGVGEYAFDGCSSLKKVMFNQGVLCIGTMAFHQCSSLENINLPSNLAVIDDYAGRWYWMMGLMKD